MPVYKTLKIFILISCIAYLFLFFLSPKKIFAQNIFVCEYVGTTDHECSVNLWNSSCPGTIVYGDPEQLYCEQYNDDPDACANAAGYCNTCLEEGEPLECIEGESCPENYSPISGTCVSPTAKCCLPNTSTPPPVDVCYECVITGFGDEAYCVAIEPPGNDCGQYWTDQQVCETECQVGQPFESFTCTDSHECQPASNGEYTGENAYSDCLDNCFLGEYADQKLFCDAHGNPTENSSSGKLYTAIGCIPFTNTEEFISFILRWALGLGAGIGFLLIVYAGFIIATSKGNPDKLKAGQELMTSAIMGLVLIIFSVFILRIIGVDILKIPGFSE